MEKFLFKLCLLLLFSSEIKATVYPIKIGTTYQSFYNLCTGDTLRFTGDSLNQNAYGIVSGYVYNKQTHIYDNFTITSFTNLATTYDHILIAGDSCYSYNLSGPPVMFPWGLHFNCIITNSHAHTVESDFNIYPIPVRSFVTISTPYNFDKIELMNVTGQVLQSESVNIKEHQINLNHFSEGIYFVRITYSNGLNVTKKIVKQ